jgi:hypothetical protein
MADTSITYSRLPDTSSNPTPAISGADYGFTYDSSGSKVWVDQSGKPTGNVEARPFNEAETRNTQIAQREAQFGTINDLYNKRIADFTTTEKDLGAKDLARANTISAMTGGAGGVDAASSGASVEAGTKKIIQSKTDSINFERAQALSGVYNQIDQNVQREKELAVVNDRAERTKKVDDMNKAASTNIMAFASQGVDWNKAIKDPEFQAEVNRTGKTAFEVQKLYNDSLPSNLKPKELFSGWKGNNYVEIHQNADGTTSTHTTTAKDIGIPVGSDIATITANNKVYWYDKSNPTKADGSLDLREIGTKNSTTTTPTGVPEGVSSTDIAEGRTRLQHFSDGGYANPYQYRDMYDLWTSKGGSPDAFLKEYPPKQYINPAHNTLKDAQGNEVLPAYLRSGTTSAGTTGAGRPQFGG